MKQGYTEIAVVLDRSGSMNENNKKWGAIEGFNTFVQTQRQQPGEARLTLVFFDHAYHLVVDRQPITEVPYLNGETYRPNGYTALLDAIGLTVVELGRQLAEMPEEERPSKVIVAILTDGMENASHIYTDAEVRAMIKEQTEVYKWEFLFLSSDLGAIEHAVALGVQRRRTMQYADDREGTQVAFAAAAASVTEMRDDAN